MADIVSHPEDYFGRLVPERDELLQSLEAQAREQGIPIVGPVVGGLLVADNTGFKDAHAFNQAMFSAAGWRSVQLFSYLPLHSGIHDGLCFAVRLQHR